MAEHSKPNLDSFRPSEFMRARRPERFSDTKILVESKLDRALLEYHLSTLTNRGQEKDFEHFCRRLAEKEICPNLLPQTGPTGGGDSKVDTETYPVVEELALLWYEGIDLRAASERWAFAISAKEDWRSKVKSDVKKIAETKRGYTRILFISNQFIRDRARAEVEDELKGIYHIDVRIFDRSWILDRVFENGRQRLAIETLNISAEFQEIRKKGPLDTEREADLEELERHIADSNRYQGIKYQLVEDALQAAILSRELELPRVEIDGRFARAERLATEYGTKQQELRCAYAKAWTAIWWFDDFSTFTSLYGDVENLAFGSHLTAHVELVANLWYILSSSVHRGQLSAIQAHLKKRTDGLKNELRRLASATERPNSSIYAQTILLLIELTEAKFVGGAITATLTELREVLKNSKGLVNYPVFSFIQIIVELGEYITDDSTFDEVFEDILAVSQERESEAVSGKLLLKRGIQKLEAGKRYDAIRFLGRAQPKLATHETRSELFRSLYLCGRAYESAGLLWAARANMLVAAHIAINEFWTEGNVILHTVTSVQRLVWLEIQLGRVPHALAWIELATTLVSAMHLEGDVASRFQEERENQDLVLGALLLKTDLWGLKWIDFLPETLDRLGLSMSWMALLYNLGYEDRLRSDGIIPHEDDAQTVEGFFREWLNQPASGDIPDSPEFLSERTIIFHSKVIGCRITINVENNANSIVLAESILGVLEMFLATSLITNLVPYVEEIRLNIQLFKLDSTSKPRFQVSQDRLIPQIDIWHPNTRLDTDSESYQVWLLELIANVIAYISYTPNPEELFKKLGEEGAHNRALSFSNPLIPLENLLGNQPKISLSKWESVPVKESFPIKRTKLWNKDKPKESSSESHDSPKFGEGEPPNSFDAEGIKHNQRRVFSLINNSLWDKAGWSGAFFMSYLDDRLPPYLGILFGNREVGCSIFSQWKEKIGEVDKDEQLSISIITGISKSNPFWYRIIIGTSLDWAKLNNNSQGIFVSRFHTMEASDPMNLSRFITGYKQTGRYFFAPATFPGGATQPTLFNGLAIQKQKLSIRSAWEIGENDPDIIGLKIDDDIIIPDGVNHAPALGALKRKQKIAEQD